MDIHLSEDAARFIQTQLTGSGCRSASEFVERLLRELRSGETPAMTLYSPGAIVLVRFPFSLLHTAKKRPAVVISPAAYFLRYGGLVVLALTSGSQPEPFLALQH